VSLVSGANKPIVDLQGINFTSAVSLIDNKLDGTGKAAIDKINVAKRALCRKVGTSVTLGSDEVKLAPLSGKLADGS